MARKPTCICEVCAKCVARARSRKYRADGRYDEREQAYRSDPTRKAVASARNKARLATPEGKAQHAKALRSWRGVENAEAASDILRSQGGKCKLCPQTLEDHGKGSHVDHNHITGEIRGILCHNCNTSLGKLGDDADGLRRAACYVSSYEDPYIFPTSIEVM